MPYTDSFLLFFGALSIACAANTLRTARFTSIEYDDMTGVPAIFWGLVWLAAGLTLCAGVLFDIGAIKAPFRWFLEMHG